MVMFHLQTELTKKELLILNGVRYGQKDIVIPPRRVLALGDFQNNKYQTNNESIFKRSACSSKKCVLSIRCDKRIIISPYIGTLKANEPSAPCLGNVQECDIWNWKGKYALQLVESPYIKYVGKSNCKFFNLTTLRIIQYVAHEIYEKFPDRPDRTLWVGDGCPITGNCSGHPGSSHSGLTKCDVNYYVLNGLNSTQYGLTSEIKYNGVSDGTTVFDNFDWERNYYLIKRLNELTNNRRSRTCNVIKKFIANKIKDIKLKDQWYKMLESDLGSKYNHHMHYHLELEIV